MVLVKTQHTVRANMTYSIYYDRSDSKCWWAYWVDTLGNQLGEAVSSTSKEECLIQLGIVHDDRLMLMCEQMKNV